MSVRARIACVAPAVLALASFARAAAAADQAPRRAPFGAAGQFILDDVVGAGSRPGVGSLGGVPSYGGIVSYSRQTYASGAGALAYAYGSETLSVSPTFDFFIARHISLGVELGGAWIRQSNQIPAADKSTTWAISVAPRIGYVIPLGGELSLWPRVALGGSYQSTSGLASAGIATGELAAFELPLVLRVHPRVFLSAEPVVSISHGSSCGSGPTMASSTRADVNGYFGAGLIL